VATFVLIHMSCAGAWAWGRVPELLRESGHDVLAPDLDLSAGQTTGETKLTGGSGINSNPAWSPDGRKIAFFSNRDLEGGIWVMNADGPGEHRVTSDLAFGENFAPDWSPDGTRIAFHTTRHGFGEESIYVMDADGSNETRLTSGVDRLPSWSPDGSEILFTSIEGAGSELRVVGANGDGERGLTDPARPGQGVRSPQGNKAAFSHRPTGVSSRTCSSSTPMEATGPSC